MKYTQSEHENDVMQTEPEVFLQNRTKNEEKE